MIKAMSRILIVLVVFSLALSPLPANAQTTPVFTVGSGNPASCSSDALMTAVRNANQGGGLIRFDCGGPAEIVVNQTLPFNNRRAVYEIDGGGMVTLSGGSQRRIIFIQGGSLTVRNISLVNGYAYGQGDNASGAAIRSDNDISLDNNAVKLFVDNVTFRNNVSRLSIPEVGFFAFDYGGGAIYSRSAFLNIQNSRFEENYANNASGGAIHTRNSFVFLNNNSFIRNKSDGGGYGGAIHIDGATPNTPGSTPLFGTDGKIEIYNSVFRGNTAHNQGGGVYSYLYQDSFRYETLILDGVLFRDNAVLTNTSSDEFLGPRTFGGGLAADGWGGSGVIIRNSTFYNNSTKPTGSGGGAALSQLNSVQISNSVFDSNIAYGPNVGNYHSTGGGLVVASASTKGFSIKNTTISNNYAFYTGGGIQNDMPNGMLQNTIIANNRTDNYNTGSYANLHAYQQCRNPFPKGGTNIQYPGDWIPCSNNQVVADPLLKPISEYTPNAMILEPYLGSPAVNAGTTNELTRDILGRPRPISQVFDIGAVETQSILGVLETPGFNPGVQASVTFSGYVLEANPRATASISYVYLVAGTSCSAPSLASAQLSIPRPEILAENKLSISYDPIGFTMDYRPKAGEEVFTVCAKTVFSNQNALIGTRFVCPSCASVYLPLIGK